MKNNIINVVTVLDYIEDNLAEKLDLETIANAVHYSKYHLHRVFMDTIHMSIRDYVVRRKLTESAKLLVFSNKSIMEIALIAGYESQQAFTTSFKFMYKKTPNEYRKAEEFYPLQLRYNLNNQPTKVTTEIDWRTDIRYALESDIDAWMNLVHQVIDGFPNLKEEEYLEKLKQCIHSQQAFVIFDGSMMIGAMAFCKETGSVEFLGVHPQYRKHDIARSFLLRLYHELLNEVPISVTTFREGDKADTGYRDAFKQIGFAEGELLTEYGYPTQKMILKKSMKEESDCE
ncbi:MAG: AraC family transcriptional regulator [Longicatena sp.]